MVEIDFLINESQLPYTILSTLKTDVIGSWFLTLLLLYIIIIGFALALKMPLEFTSILIIPLTLVLMAFSGEFMGMGIALLLYGGFILAKNFIIQK